MSIVVFAGPSLHGHQPPKEVTLLPPAACGDILDAARNDATRIGLIDGTFEAGPSVWHKEIFYALSLGCPVYGAASMGALRAAECAAFGMIGVGAVFESYTSGKRESDADVALVHGPAETGFMPLTVPIVDVEDAVIRMAKGGRVDKSDTKALLSAARRLDFRIRTWPRLLSSAQLSQETRESVTDWLASAGPSLKTRDALALLSAIVQEPKQMPPVTYRETLFLKRLSRDSRRPSP